jgi:hypothetical protein
MTGRYLAILSYAACLSWTAAVRAQVGAEPNAPAARPPPSTDALPVTVKLVSTPLEAEAIRTAIAAELNVAVRLENSLVDEGLAVTVRWRRATVSYRSKQGETTTRSLDLSANSEQAVEVIALLAGNLARDEASELLARLAPPPPPPATDTPASESGTTSAEESAAEKQPPPPAEKKEPEKAKAEAPKKKAPKKADDGLIRSEKYVANASFFHPIAIRRDSERRVLNLEIGALYSRVGAVEGVGFTLGYLRVEQHVHGVVGAFGWTRVNGLVEGAQGGLFSEGHGTLKGAEFGFLATLRYGDMKGAHGAGLFVMAKNVEGVQGALVSYADDVLGGQGGLVSVARDVTGAQGGLVTWSRDVVGGQAGLVNLARDMVGGQAGLVNVARSADVQLGLVNVAERIDGAAIGLINIAGNGYIEPTAYAIFGSRPSYNAGMKFVAGLAYSVLAAGTTGFGSDAQPVVEAGLGLHVEPPILRDGPVIDRSAVELGAHVSDQPNSNPEQNFVHYRLGLGVRFVRTLWLFGGYDVSHDANPFGDVGQGPWAGVAVF